LSRSSLHATLGRARHRPGSGSRPQSAPSAQPGLRSGDSGAQRTGGFRAALDDGARRELCVLLRLRVRHLERQSGSLSSTAPSSRLAGAALAAYHRPARRDRPVYDPGFLAGARHLAARYRRPWPSALCGAHRRARHRHRGRHHHARLRDSVPAARLGECEAEGGAPGTGPGCRPSWMP
jgi:hypothetical protein